MSFSIAKITAEEISQAVESTTFAPSDEVSDEVLDCIGDGPTEAELERRKLNNTPTEAEITAGATEAARLSTLADIPAYTPEEQDERVLVRGRWLEQGGSAWIVSTAGTGKSIHAMQLAMCFTHGVAFSGLTPARPLRVLIMQTEDLPSRLAVDRADITAELTDQLPDYNWEATWANISFADFPGKVGAEFLDDLDAFLTAHEGSFDILIINPFLAYIGGPITDGQYVTPFLRGGEINRKRTKGLQYILERHRVGAIIYHHTPKPPSDAELDGWLKSAFPEYQGAGSSDITNWGRSFITMMRTKERTDMVCLTAGKNGGDLGWRRIGGAYRYYLAHSNEQGCGGKNRHGWRVPDEDEIAEVAKDATMEARNAAQLIADFFRAQAGTTMDARNALLGKSIKKRLWREAFAIFLSRLPEYGLVSQEYYAGKGPKNTTVYGTEAAVNEFISANFE